MTTQNRLQLAFLIVGALTVLEFTLVRGMFTWLIAVIAVLVTAALNIIYCCRHRQWLPALLFLLTAAALVMGYLTLA